jgi:hypothetical protein
MDPVMLHGDGTDCRHEGNAQAAISDEGGPICPAGLPITHMRFNGNTLTIEQAYTSLKSMADAWVKALNPIVTALAAWGRQVSGDPVIRALAAASAVVDEERQRETANGATA